MIRAVIFDIGGVVLGYTGCKTLYEKVSKKFKINIRDFANARKKYCDEYYCGRMSTNDFFGKLGRDVGISGIDLQKFWTKYYPKQMKVRKHIINLVRRLKSAKYKVALLSNTCDLHIALNKRKGFFNEFPVRVMSCEVGFAKPGERIYIFALNQLACQPEECIFIDNELENIAAAEKLGMRGIFFKNNRQLAADLKRFNVKL